MGDKSGTKKKGFDVDLETMKGTLSQFVSSEIKLDKVEEIMIMK